MTDYSSGRMPCKHITIDDIHDTLSEDTYSLVELCNSDKINIYSRCKPTRISSYIPSYDMTGNVRISVTSIEDFVNWSGNPFSIVRPDFASIGYFRNYRHNRNLPYRSRTTGDAYKKFTVWPGIMGYNDDEFTMGLHIENDIYTISIYDFYRAAVNWDSSVLGLQSETVTSYWFRTRDQGVTIGLFIAPVDSASSRSAWKLIETVTDEGEDGEGTILSGSYDITRHAFNILPEEGKWYYVIYAAYYNQLGWSAGMIPFPTISGIRNYLRLRIECKTLNTTINMQTAVYYVNSQTCTTARLDYYMTYNSETAGSRRSVDVNDCSFQMLINCASTTFPELVPSISGMTLTLTQGGRESVMTCTRICSNATYPSKAGSCAAVGSMWADSVGLMYGDCMRAYFCGDLSPWSGLHGNYDLDAVLEWQVEGKPLITPMNIGLLEISID